MIRLNTIMREVDRASRVGEQPAGGHAACRRLDREGGADAIVTGCTELPLVLSFKRVSGVDAELAASIAAAMPRCGKERSASSRPPGGMVPSPGFSPPRRLGEGPGLVVTVPPLAPTELPALGGPWVFRLSHVR